MSGYRPRYDKGDHKAICDVCGRLFKASSLKKRWDGLMTCSYDWEFRQPQDFVRGKADIQAPKWTRPEVSDAFIGCFTTSGIAGVAIAGCAIAGNEINPGVTPPSSFTV